MKIDLIYLRKINRMDVINEGVERGIIVGKIIMDYVKWVKLCKQRGFRVFDPYDFEF